MIQTWRNSECCYVTSGYALYIRPVTFELTALFEEKQPGEPTHMMEVEQTVRQSNHRGHTYVSINN